MKKSILLFGVFMAANFGSLSAKTFGGGHTVKLNSGYEMPSSGLGAWTLTGETCENAVYSAL